MQHSPLRVAASLLLFGVCFLAPVRAHCQGVPLIRSVQVLRSGGRLEIEIEASAHIVPQTNLLTSPDRLIVDFVNARPGAQLRSIPVNRAAVKNVRVGLFSADPPVTRLVLDLYGPQPYEVFPSGKTVIVKIGGSSDADSATRHFSGPGLVNANYSAQPGKISPATNRVNPRLEVSFEGGLLSVNSNKANLSEVLFAIHERTGAEIAIPAGTEQEQVAADLGPAPAPEVLAHLLNGSRFNFMILSSATDSRALDRVILSPRSDSPIQPGPVQARPEAEEDDQAVQSRVVAPAGPTTPGASAENPNPTPAPPDTKPADNEVPD